MHLMCHIYPITGYQKTSLKRSAISIGMSSLFQFKGHNGRSKKLLSEIKLTSFSRLCQFSFDA